MPNCPECKEEIDSLDINEQVTEYSTVSLDGEYLQWDLSDSDHSGSWSGFCCPNCGVVVANTEDEAISILRGNGNTKLGTGVNP